MGDVATPIDPGGLAGEIVVQLLDPEYQRPIRTWRFADRSEISIGRGNDADIEISDPYVSRLHAQLVLREERWVLISRGRNGIYVGERAAPELPIQEAVIVRLGSAGPLLRLSSAEPVDAGSGTLSYSAETSPLLQLDETKLREDVAQIESEEFFQKLQQQAQQLRHRRDTCTG